MPQTEDLETDADGLSPSEEEDAVWTDLVRWVRTTDRTEKKNSSDDGNGKGGGYVHPSLALSGRGPSRGVRSTAPIARGELLIRIRSEHVLSGAAAVSTMTGASTANATDETKKAPNTTGSPMTAVSPWLRCVGAFLRAKRYCSVATTAEKEGRDAGDDPSWYGPYLRSLPSPDEYETLQNWSTRDEVQSFLKGTTLGELVTIDRATKGIQTRYRDSVKPYLIGVGAVDGTTLSTPSPSTEPASTDADYRAFLEATMCISTRGFHLLPTESNSKDTTVKADTEGATSSNRSSSSNDRYDGPFLLPVIDLLNHDPERSCTTLRRHESTGTTGGGGGGGGSFVMVAERDIAEGEEIFHSYGAELTSAQLLQTFGFVPRKHSSNARAAAASGERLPSATPVGLRNGDHLIAATRSLKASSFPDAVMDRMRAAKGPSTASHDSDDEDDDDDDDDCFWEVCDIPDRNLGSGNDEFLVSAWHSRNGSLLTDETVTLAAAQFLPAEAFDDIFPDGGAGGAGVTLDRSILEEDRYLGVLVCKSLLVALFLRAREYCANPGDGNNDEGSAGAVAKAVSGGAPAAVGRYTSSLLENEASRLSELLEQTDKPAKDPEIPSRSTEREIYGRTIRTEELTNLAAFCKELETLLESLSLGGENDERGGDSHEDLPPQKRVRVE